MNQIVAAYNPFIYRYIILILQREQTWFISSCLLLEELVGRPILATDVLCDPGEVVYTLCAILIVDYESQDETANLLVPEGVLLQGC